MLMFEAMATEGLFSRIRRIMLDADGFELFSCEPGEGKGNAPPILPSDVGYAAGGHKWRSIVELSHRELLHSPLCRSPRFSRA